MKHVETQLEKFLFASRWLLVPFYLGLVLALALLLVKFVKEFVHFVPLVFTAEGGDVIIGVLTLVDVVMVANLLIIIVFAGYENFVSRFDAASHEDWPGWMGHVGFAELKISAPTSTRTTSATRGSSSPARTAVSGSPAPSPSTAIARATATASADSRASRCNTERDTARGPNCWITSTCAASGRTASARSVLSNSASSRGLPPVAR